MRGKNRAASCFECEGACDRQERGVCNRAKIYLWELKLARFEIVITVTKAIIVAAFPPVPVVQLDRKLALGLVLHKHATEGEAGAGEADVWCPAGHGEEQEGVEDPDKREGVACP